MSNRIFQNVEKLFGIIMSGNKRICLQWVPKTPNTLNESDLCAVRGSHKRLLKGPIMQQHVFLHSISFGNFGKGIIEGMRVYRPSHVTFYIILLNQHGSTCI